MSSRLKRVLGKYAYVWRSLVEIVRYRDARYRVVVDGQAWRGASVVVANGRHYGGPYIVAPAASLAAPRLDVCVFQKAGRIAALSYSASLLLGQMGRRRDVAFLQGAEVRIEGPAHEPVQADGDIVAHLPVTVRLSERKLPLIVAVVAFILVWMIGAYVLGRPMPSSSSLFVNHSTPNLSSNSNGP